MFCIILSFTHTRVDSNRAALRSRVSNQPSGLLLSPRVWRIGMSTKTAATAGKTGGTCDSHTAIRDLESHARGRIRIAAEPTAACGKDFPRPGEDVA